LQGKASRLRVVSRCSCSSLALLLLALLILSGCQPQVQAGRATTSTSGGRTLSGQESAAEGPPPVVLTPPPRAAVPPVRLLIPAIGVDAAVEEVGVAADGTLATPAVRPWDDVGWYSGGPAPGQQGSAVIAGHLDRPGGYPAVFWNLRLLVPGEQITVVDARGVRRLFRITRVATYAPTQAPLQEIFGDLSGRYLNLITCAGTWIPSQHQTSERLVVYSTLLGPVR
jgi:hypothetical protein